MKLVDELYVQQLLLKLVLDERTKDIDPKVTAILKLPENYYNIAVDYLKGLGRESRGHTNYEFAGKSIRLVKIESLKKKRKK